VRRPIPLILPLFRRNFHHRSIRALYGTIVAQARSAAFYAIYGVPDTMPARFDLIVLHLVLVLRRLVRDGDSPASHGRGLGQGLFDAFCRDLDDNLREMGVGDLAVPKEMRRFGEAFYGRQAAYHAAIVSADPRELEKALARNIFGVADADDRVIRLAGYVRAVIEELDIEDERALVSGVVSFPKPESFAYAPT